MVAWRDAVPIALPYKTHPGDNTRYLFAPMLLLVQVNPGTVLLPSYSTDREGPTDTSLGRVPLTTTGRSFFLRLRYAWRP